MISERNLFISIVMTFCILFTSDAGCQEPRADAKGLVAVSPEHQTCRFDTECAVVNLDCTSCQCDLATVNSSAFDLYARACAEHRSKACDKACPLPRVVCRKKKCEVIALSASAVTAPAAQARKAAEKTVDKAVEKPIDKAVDKFVAKPVDEAVDKDIDKPVDKAVDKATEKVVEKAVDTASVKDVRGRLAGTVTLRTGDCGLRMQGEPDRCVLTPVKRKVLIHRRLSGPVMGQPGVSGEYLNIADEPVLVVESDEQGHYRADLPLGEYSIFVDDNGREYCNFFDGTGGICLVTILDGTVEFNITINHATD